LVSGGVKLSRSKKLVLFVAIFSFIFLSFPGFSSAHAYIKKSTPFENQILTNPPNKVSIEFNETIQTSFHSLRVSDMNGKQVDKGDSHIDPKNSSIIECGVKSHLPDGTYRIEWKVVSSDGHPVEGVIPFGVGQVSVDQTTLKSKSTGYFPHLDLILIRWFQFISGSIFIGLIFFYLFVISKINTTLLTDRFKKLILYSYLLLCLSVLVNLPLQATIEANVTWNQVFNLSLLRDMLLNSFAGKVWACQVIALVLLSFTTAKIVKRNNTQILFWQVSFILGCCFLLAKAFTSHAFSADHRFISITLDFLHLLGASIWTGSLMAMIILLPLRRKEESKLLYKEFIRGFFKWGIAIVLVLTVTGIYSSLLYVTTFNSLFTTNYGQVLLVKVSLFFIMLVFALINFLKGKTAEEKRWGFSLRGELTTGFIILVLAVILTNLPTASSTPGPFKETKNFNKDNQVTLNIDPKVIGINHFEVTLKDKTGKPLDNIQQVVLTFKPTGRKMKEDTVTIPQVSLGRFYTQGMSINGVGRWNINVHVLTRELNDYDITYSFSVGNQ
jgi:copper transport protein